MTTLEPGARLVFTQGLTLSPRSTAFRASRPAPTSTYGFEVLVHDVMAAMTTLPCLSANFEPSSDVSTAASSSTAGGVCAGAALALRFRRDGHLGKRLGEGLGARR